MSTSTVYLSWNFLIMLHLPSELCCIFMTWQKWEACVHSFVYVILLEHSVIPWCPLLSIDGSDKKEKLEKIIFPRLLRALFFQAKNRYNFANLVNRFSMHRHSCLDKRKKKTCLTYLLHRHQLAPFLFKSSESLFYSFRRSILRVC